MMIGVISWAILFSVGAQAVEISETLTFPAREIASVEFKSAVADFEFMKSPDSRIHVEISGEFPVGEENKKAFSEVSGSHLVLRTPEVDNKNHSVRSKLGLKANVLVRLPANVQEVSINTISGDIKAQGLKLKKAKFVAVSGDIELPRNAFEHLVVKTVSGDIEVGGSILNSEIEAVSGDIQVNSESIEPQLRVNTTSGDAKILFRDSPNVKVALGSISGALILDPGLRMVKSSPSVKEIIFGKGNGSVNAKTISGNLRIGLWN